MARTGLAALSIIVLATAILALIAGFPIYKNPVGGLVFAPLAIVVALVGFVIAIKGPQLFQK